MATDGMYWNFEIRRASGLGALQFPRGRRQGDRIDIERGYAVEPADVIVDLSEGAPRLVLTVEHDMAASSIRLETSLIEPPHLP